MIPMSEKKLPWSFYAVLLSFGVFFGSLNIYILSKILSHPLPSDPWLIGVVVGLVGLIYSVRMVRIHQRELIEKKRQQEASSE